MEGFNVENFRDEHESNSEWRMRKEFLATNFRAVPLDRLICLSRCFISIEVYGCTYPSEVMDEVQHFSENVSPSIMAKQRERMKQKHYL
ncbi:hypothetical protein ACOMHN_001583 [Nucella lapillus]